LAVLEANYIMCYDRNTQFPSAASYSNPVEDAKQEVQSAINNLVEALGEAAKDAIDDGDFDTARQLISEAEDARDLGDNL
jgi:oligoendopeptidase F